MQEPCMSLGLKTEVYADEALSLASTLQHSLNGDSFGLRPAVVQAPVCCTSIWVCY